MSETESDERSAAPDLASPGPAAGGGVSPGEMAARVAGFVNEEGGFRGGELPLWERLGGAGGRPSWRWRLIAAAAWCVAIALSLVAVARIFFHDAAPPLIWINAFTFYVYVPAYVVFVYAAAARRWRLCALCGALLAWHAFLIWPDVRPATPYRGAVAESASSERSVRIYFVNVHASNRKMDEILAEAESYDPDVIILAEMHRWWWMELIARDPLKKYPYGTNLQRRNAGDIGVFSRLPVTRMEQIESEYRFVLSVDLEVDGQHLRLFALHSPRPTYGVVSEYVPFWKQILPIVTRDQGPVVVIGDFNATQYSKVYRDLQLGGLRSAHEDCGRGWATTWPNGDYPIPPIRIDQVFLSPDVECVAIEEGAAPGSDHKSLIVDLIVQPAAATLPDR